jgi:hypothetical protein
VAVRKDNCCIIWRGRVYAGPALTSEGTGYEGQCLSSVVSAGAFGTLPAQQALGNVSELNLQLDIGQSSVNDYTNSENACSGEWINSRSMSFVLHCFGKSNFERAFGTIAAERSELQVTNQVISACAQNICAGDLVPLPSAPVDKGKAFALELFDTQTTAVVALVEGVDYVMTVAGPRFMRDRALNDRQVLRASYYSAATVEHESTDLALPPVSLIFEGESLINDNCGKPLSVMAIFYRVRLQRPQQASFIHTELFNQPMTGRLETVNVGGKRLAYKIFPSVEASA